MERLQLAENTGLLVTDDDRRRRAGGAGGVTTLPVGGHGGVTTLRTVQHLFPTVTAAPPQPSPATQQPPGRRPAELTAKDVKGTKRVKGKKGRKKAAHGI